MVMTPSQVRETATKSLQFSLQGVRWETFQQLMSDLSQDCGCQITYDQDNQLLLISQHGQTELNRIITLNTLTWETFTDLIADVEGSRGWRFVYDNGVLEIRMPLQEHEEPKEFLMDFITVLVDELELELEIRKLGALTLKRKDLNRGIEPDSCCYIQNEFLVRGKDIDLTLVPPPDLAVESDYSGSRINEVQSTLTQ
jgi:Uma2 family endonuclease